MTPPPSPTPTGLSVVRNVAQGMRLVLELPEHQSPEHGTQSRDPGAMVRAATEGCSSSNRTPPTRRRPPL